MIDKNFTEIPAWQNENITLLRNIGLVLAVFFALLTYYSLDFKILFLIAYIFFLVSAVYFPKLLAKIKIIKISFELKNIFLKLNNIIIAFLLFFVIIGLTTVFFRSYLKKSYNLVRRFKDDLTAKNLPKENISFFKEEDEYTDLVSKYC